MQAEHIKAVTECEKEEKVPPYFSFSEGKLKTDVRKSSKAHKKKV